MLVFYNEKGICFTQIVKDPQYLTEYKIDRQYLTEYWSTINKQSRAKN